jgi:hypothetical protein
MTANPETEAKIERGAPLTLEDLMSMNGPELLAVMRRGLPLEPDVLAGRQYLGVDLSLPGWARKILWHTFRKTFVKDEKAGDVRGWNVRMKQTGIDAPQVPMTGRDGRPKTFGHYRIRSAVGLRFPKGWTGPNYLDYTIAGNPPYDPAGYGYTPLIAVNPGSQDLLLGWEIFKIGPAFLPLPLFWALRYDGPLEEVVDPPRRRA